MHQTTLAKPSTVRENWILVDAKDVVLGRLATRIAMAIQGKNKPEYTPHIDTGDHVVVINAEKIAITGAKAGDKVYRHHTLYPGGLKEISYERMMNNHPDRIISEAVRRMMPKSIMGRKMMRKLHIYVGAQHPHTAQNPVATDLINTNKGV
jgi:large subunit ribosomal protein L13